MEGIWRLVAWCYGPSPRGVAPPPGWLNAPRCVAKGLRRRVWYHLERESPLLAKDVLKLLHVTPKYCLYRRLSRMKGIEYVPIDLQPAPLAGQTAALARLPFPSDRVGSICVHVLEHAASDLEAMKEPGGVTVVNVPTRLSHPTFEEPTITAPEARRAAIDEIHAELTGQIMDYLTSRGRIPGMHDRPGGFG